MNEFKQFRHFTPQFWQEDGVLVEVVAERPEFRRPRARSGGSKWTFALAASAILLSTVTSFAFSVPDAGAGRRAAVTEEAVLPNGPSRYAEVSPDHWAKLRSFMRTLPRTAMMDKFKDPEVPC